MTRSRPQEGLTNECSFSIVIPAYNAERYVTEAIESVIRQDYPNWELIIVNDGSTDRTEETCRIAALDDARIRVINNVRKGVSAARNEGIMAARSDYLFFLDSDDKLCDNVMKDIAELLSALSYFPDIVFGTYRKYNERTHQESLYCFDYRSDLQEIKGAQIWNRLYTKKPVFSCPIMAQVYRVEFLQKNNLLFDERLFVSEDHDWRYSVFSKSNLYYSCNICMFTYYQRMSDKASVTHSPMTYAKYANSQEYLIKWYRKSLYDEELLAIRPIILGLIGEDYANKAIDIVDILNTSEREKAKQLFIRDAYIMDNARFNKYRISTLIYKLFGIDFYLFCLAGRCRLMQRVIS